jgi:nucleoside-diphosphate-sugar epimerase
MNNSPPKTIAFLGATGHIAKSLADGFCREGRHELLLFARSPERLNNFSASLERPGSVACLPLVEFGRVACDVVVNCVGIGDPGRQRIAGGEIFRITETFDTLALEFVESHPGSRSIHFSSGAAYGSDFREPAGKGTHASFDINNITPAHYYGIAKMHSEAKHRALPHLPIVDLRIFSFFSRFIDLEGKFFLSEVLSCLRRGHTLVTGPDDVVRDYVDPRDLLALVSKCIDGEEMNDAFDVYSLKPACKFEIIEYFASRYGLKYLVDRDLEPSSATGLKPLYYSTNRKAERIGYLPRFTSMDGIASESEAILRPPGTTTGQGIRR